MHIGKPSPLVTHEGVVSPVVRGALQCYRHLLGNGPHKTDQFTRNGDGHDIGVFLIPSDFVVHSFRPPMEEAMSRLWSQLG